MPLLRLDRAHPWCYTKPHRPRDLAAATLATVRLSRMVVLVFHRILIELVFASGTAKGIFLSSVLGLPSGGSDVYVDVANGIFYNGCANHWEIGITLVCESVPITLLD